MTRHPGTAPLRQVFAACAMTLVTLAASSAAAQRAPGPAAPATLPAPTPRPPQTPPSPQPLPPTGPGLGGGQAVSIYPSMVYPSLCLPGSPMPGPGMDDSALPADARMLLDRYAQAWADAEREVFDRLAHEREQLIRDLQDIQDEETRAGRLDEALSVRTRIRQLQGNPDAPAPFVPLAPGIAGGCAGSPITFTIAPTLMPGMAPQPPQPGGVAPPVVAVPPVPVAPTTPAPRTPASPNTPNAPRAPSTPRTP
jgi:hypothetical protein